MKAALITGINKLEITDVPVPVIPEKGVLVKMQSAAVCGTDVKMLANGHRDLSLPRVPGHEGCGVVVESLNDAFKPGDAVAVYPGIFCGKCENCLKGHTARCESIGIYGFNKDGIFREFVPFTESEIPSLVPVSSGSVSNELSLSEPLACCISGYRKVPVKNGAALIVGAGSAGSIFAALLAAEGFKKIVIADRDAKRLKTQVPVCGEVIEADAVSLENVLTQNGCECPFDLIVPCCPEGLNWPFWNFMNKGGAAILFSGNTGNITNRAIDANEVHYRELVLAGSYGCNMDDFKDAVEMIEQGKIDLSFLAPQAASLDELPAAIEKVKNGIVKKVVIDRF